MSLASDYEQVPSSTGRFSFEEEIERRFSRAGQTSSVISVVTPETHESFLDDSSSISRRASDGPPRSPRVHFANAVEEMGRAENAEKAFERCPSDDCVSQASSFGIHNLSLERLSNTWAWEIGAALVAVLCFLAIIISLLAINNTALLSWGPAISPNALIQIFAAFLGSALALILTQTISQLKWLFFRQRPGSLASLKAFDEAGRGPWGAFQFLVRFRLGAIVASIAAIVTILNLAVAPFLQQLISYRDQWVSLGNTTAFTSTSAVWDTGNIAELSPLTDPTTYTSLRMQSAIAQGIYQIEAPIQPHCPNSNCSWPSGFACLGICSNCTDVTDKVHKSCTSKDSFPDGHSKCTYTFPNGAELLGMTTTSNETVVDGTMLTALAWNSNGTKTGNKTLTTSDPATLVEWASLRFGSQPRNLLTPVNPKAYQCSLYVCEKQWKSLSIVNNTLNGYEATNTSPLTQCGSYTTSDGKRMSRYCGSTWSPFDGNYTVNAYSQQSTSSFLVDLLNTTMFTNRFSPNRGINAANVIYYAKGGIPGAAESMAASMTESIRLNSNNTLVYGVAWTNATYIHVQWAWIILPVLVILATFGLLIATIVYTARQESVMLWKSLPLAPYFHGLEGWTLPTFNTETTSQMNEAAEHMRGRLMRDRDNKWKIVRAPDS